jgi:NAD(P)-dependent dehydrogenase (short-subunit alcohol dehydrogenase family)
VEKESKVAIVTGSASGIGEAAAALLAHRGYRVVIADVRDDLAQQTADRLNASGGTATAVAVDIASAASIGAMKESVLSQWGRIDALINNAGVESSRPFLEIGLDEYERVMRVNTTGAWLCCQAVIPVMMRQQSGVIVNVSSVAGQRGGGLLGTAAYATSKGALIAMTKALAREFAQSGIRVNAVAPALTNTEFARRQLELRGAGTLERIIGMTPLGRVAEPREIAEVIAFLVSPEASFVTGHVYNADGGSAM